MSPSHPRMPMITAVLAITLLTVACATDDAGTSVAAQTPEGVRGATAHDAAEGEQHDDDPDWGRPADPAAADRIVDIVAADDFTFDPAAVEVAVGETVTFRVVNVGNLPHEFTLGDVQTQQRHEAEMAAMAAGGMSAADEPDAVTLPPGERRDITWRFQRPGAGAHGVPHPRSLRRGHARHRHDHSGGLNDGPRRRSRPTRTDRGAAMGMNASAWMGPAPSRASGPAVAA